MVLPLVVISSIRRSFIISENEESQIKIIPSHIRNEPNGA